MTFTYKKTKLIAAMLSVFLLVTACDSPEQKAQNFIENGQKLYKEGSYTKSAIEFKNALQIDKKLLDAWYGLALAEEKNGKWKQVAGSLKNTLDLDPNHFEANLKLGKLLMLAGKPDVALEYSNKVIELNTEHAGANSLQATVLFKMKDVDGALKYANKALSLDPVNMEAILLLAAHAIRNEEGEKSLAYLDQAITAHKDSLGLKLIKIQALESLGRGDESEVLFKELLTSDPKNIDISNAFTTFYLNQNKLKEAEQVLRDLAEARGNDEIANLRVVAFLNETHGSEKAIAELENLIATKMDNFTYKLSLVDLLSSGGMNDKAVEVLDTILKAEKDEKRIESAKLRLAEVYTADGQVEKSKEIYEPILSADGLNERGLLLRAAYQISNNELDAAIGDLRSVLRGNPESIRALYMLGNVYTRTDAFELANDRYNLAFKASDFSPSIGLMYAQFHMDRKKPQRAEDTLVKVVQKGRATLQVLEGLANIRLQTGDWMGAQEVVEMMRQAGTDEQKTLKFQGHIYAGLKRFDESIKTFETAYNKSPLESQPMVDLVRSYVQSGKMEDAHRFIDSVLVANQESFYGNLLKARLFTIEDKRPEAVDSYEKAINSDPKNMIGYRTFASFHMADKNFDGATAILDRGLAVENESVILTLMKAGILEMQQKTDEAISAYEQILASQPENLIAKNNLANLLLMAKGDQQRITRAYELAKTFEDSKVPVFRDTLGLAYLEKGETEKAKVLFEELAGKFPDAAVFKYHLGITYKTIGDVEGAKKVLNDALEKADSDPSVRKSDIEAFLKGMN